MGQSQKDLLRVLGQRLYESGVVGLATFLDEPPAEYGHRKNATFAGETLAESVQLAHEQLAWLQHGDQGLPPCCPGATPRRGLPEGFGLVNFPILPRVVGWHPGKTFVRQTSPAATPPNKPPSTCGVSGNATRSTCRRGRKADEPPVR